MRNLDSKNLSDMSFQENIISNSKNRGVEECEVVILKKRIVTVRITDSEIAEIKENQEKSAGIRIIKDSKISSIQTTDFTNSNDVLEKALETWEFIKTSQHWKAFPYQKKINKIDSTYDKNLANISVKEISDISQEMVESTKNKKVSSISGSLNVITEEFNIANSNELNLNDKSTYISGIINAESNTGLIPVSGFGQMCCRTLDEFDSIKIGKQASDMCLESINPVKCEQGEYSVIFEPYSVGEILAFVLALNFNLKTYSEKKSCFNDLSGKKIASDIFSLIDDPHVPNGIGSKSFDDEGVQTRQNELIKNGIFQNLFSNLNDSFLYDHNPTGNGNRQGTPMGRDSNPNIISSPHNLRISGDSTKKDDMIKDVKKGLLIGRLWYTYAVNPIKGDFSCTARSGIRIIEDGQIKSPGKSVRIIHNLPTALTNISAIGDDHTNVIQWASTPSITPSIRIDNVNTISI